MDIDNMLLDLELIRQLAENDKLAVNVYPGVTTLIVDKSSYLSSITRKIYGKIYKKYAYQCEWSEK